MTVPRAPVPHATHPLFVPDRLNDGDGRLDEDDGNPTATAS